MNAIRSLLLAFGVIGALLFGAAFMTSILNPGYVEEIAKDLIASALLGDLPFNRASVTANALAFTLQIIGRSTLSFSPI